MGKQSYMSLLMVFLVLAQGIMVSSEESIEASSAFFNRQKRASFSSGLKRTYSPEWFPKKRGLQDEPVKVMRGTVQIGIGIVVHPLVIAAKSSIFRAREAYHVECTGPNGETIIRSITEVRPYYKSQYLRESPGGIHDVALAITNGPMPFENVPMPEDDYPILRRLQSIGHFSPYKIDCIKRMLKSIIARLDAREE